MSISTTSKDRAEQNIIIQSNNTKLDALLDDLNLFPLLKLVDPLAESAVLLGVDNPTRSNFLRTLVQLARELDATEDDIFEETLQKQKRDQRIAEAKSLNALLNEMATNLQEDSKVFETENLANKQSRQVFITKISEYKTITEKYIEKVNTTAVNSELTHKALKELLSELEALEEQYEPLEAQLEAYQNLPADVTLAQIKLEEQRQKVIELDKELTKRLEQIETKEITHL